MNNTNIEDSASYLQSIAKDDIPIIQFHILNQIPGIIHGFSTKLGGVSEGPFATMNLSFTRGDKKEHVMENFRRISERLGFSLDNLVLSSQTHTTNVLLVTKRDRGEGIMKKTFQDVDGLITNDENVVLCTSYADCVPLYFVDLKTKAIGLSHSGWRGTANRMGEHTIQAMNKAFGSKPDDIVCAIGPSICQTCYEVDDIVIDEIKNHFPNSQWADIFYETKPGKYQLDLWKANEYILLDSGIKKEHIDTRRICTCCNHDILFSHRKTAGKRGNLCAFLYKSP